MQVTIHQIANLRWTLNSDHGLFHDLNHRRALILINPDISLTGPLETKPKRKTKEFSKDEANFKMPSTKWQSFCIAATLTGGVYLPVGVITLHNSSLAPKPGAHFTNDFSIVIKIVTIDFLAIISLQCFAHFTTAQLVCQVKNIVTIILLEFRWEQN